MYEVRAAGSCDQTAAGSILRPLDIALLIPPFPRRFRLNPIKKLRVASSRRLWERGSGVLRTRSMRPCQPADGVFFVIFFRQIRWLFILFWIFGP